MCTQCRHKPHEPHDEVFRPTAYVCMCLRLCMCVGVSHLSLSHFFFFSSSICAHYLAEWAQHTDTSAPLGAGVCTQVRVHACTCGHIQAPALLVLWQMLTVGTDIDYQSRINEVRARMQNPCGRTCVQFTWGNKSSIHMFVIGPNSLRNKWKLIALKRLLTILLYKEPAVMETPAYLLYIRSKVLLIYQNTREK